MTTEAQYPYKDKDGLCKILVVTQGKYKITGYTGVAAGSVSVLQTAVKT